jgi:4-amino-4-deoxy-L-arabinose transferase-like glycosyltransferase
MTAWTRRLRRLDAWLAGPLLRPAYGGRTVMACIAAFALAGLAVLIGIKFTQDLFKDNTEAYAWGRQILGGYGRHPPLTGWIAGLWYDVLPARDWASYLLSRLMVLAALASIYLLTRRVLDAHRAALVVFALMLYPLFIGSKSDRFNNYQVLLALLPLLILTFLIAYEKCTATWGALLGVVAAAAALTIYSAALGLFAVALAALVHPNRGRFFGSPAPYVAVLVFLVLIAPHLVWLVRWDFPPLHWIGDQLNTGTQLKDSTRMVVHQTALVAIPLAVAALALLPWRVRPAAQRPARSPDAILVLVIAAVLIVVPPLASFPLKVRLKPEWGDSLFFVVPTALLILAPWLTVRRRAVARMAAIATIATVIYMVAAPLYALTNFKNRPDYDAFTPTSELARDVTRLWHERFAAPLPIVLGAFEIAAPIVFYSPDHPRMFADSPDQPRIFATEQPMFSPWIDYPADLRRYGFVGICYERDADCVDYLARLAPGAEPVDVTETREVAGIRAKPWTFRLRIAPPQ